MPKYRIYACGTVVHEDYFSEYDNTPPFYDDYSEWVVPDECGDVKSLDLPEVLRNHIIENNGDS